MDPHRNSAHRLPLQQPGSPPTQTGTQREFDMQSPWNTHPAISSPPTTYYQPTTGAMIPNTPWPYTRTHIATPSNIRPGPYQTPENDPLDTGIQQSREVWRTQAYEVARSWANSTSPRQTERSANTTPIVVSAIYARPMFRDLCPRPVYVEARGSQSYTTPPTRAPPASTTQPRRQYRGLDPRQ